MKIEYHKQPIYEKRKRAGFWMGVGSFISSMAIMYGILMLVLIVLGIIGVGKILQSF